MFHSAEVRNVVTGQASITDTHDAVLGVVQRIAAIRVVIFRLAALGAHAIAASDELLP